MEKANYLKFFVGILCLSLVVCSIFLGIAYWQIYGITGWKEEVWSLAGYAATMQALHDFRDGKLRLLKIDGENDTLRFSGQYKGPFEIWIAQYLPALGQVHKYSKEQYIEFYNRKMRYMYAHPEKFQRKQDGANNELQQTP
jgi:hypothetical protein